MASLLADDLDLPTPKPALVEISQGFDHAVPQAEIARVVKDSTGVNFGSKKLPPGFTTWPVNKPIPILLRPLTAEILAFDVLIQNPDRRRENPNVLWKGDDLFIYDHELAFSFLTPILNWRPPWTGEGLEFLRNHVFYDGLRGIELKWDRLAGALEAVTDERLNEYQGAVPNEWKAKSQAALKIANYLKQARENRDSLFSAITRLLR